MKKTRESWDNNRSASLRAGIKGFWCPHCDRALIQPGSKCPICGKKDLRKKLKRT